MILKKKRLTEGIRSERYPRTRLIIVANPLLSRFLLLRFLLLLFRRRRLQPPPRCRKWLRKEEEEEEKRVRVGEANFREEEAGEERREREKEDGGEASFRGVLKGNACSPRWKGCLTRASQNFRTSNIGKIPRVQAFLRCFFSPHCAERERASPYHLTRMLLCAVAVGERRRLMRGDSGCGEGAMRAAMPTEPLFSFVARP